MRHHATTNRGKPNLSKSFLKHQKHMFNGDVFFLQDYLFIEIYLYIDKQTSCVCYRT